MSTTVVREQAGDVISQTELVALGPGWYALESFAGKRFRWGKSEAEILVASIQPANCTLKMTLQPGPGVGSKAFDLDVFDGEAKVATVKASGQPIAVKLQATEPKIFRLRLHAEAGGKAAPNESRTLDFRVFDIVLEYDPPDVLPAWATLGKGWYPLEQFAGTTFRWVNNDAEITLENRDGSKRLRLDVEPGPGVDSKPFTLLIRRSGGTENIAEVKIGAGRQTLDIPLPQDQRLNLALHVDAGGRKAPGDTRILNFRVFQSRPV